MSQHLDQQGNTAARVSISAFVDPQQRDLLVALARKSDRSFSSLVRRALAAELDRDRERTG
jgi:predicted transcriptional regulator